MCYSGKCFNEDHMGDCTIFWEDEKNFLKNKFGTWCPMEFYIANGDESNIENEMSKALHDYRMAKEIINKLTR